MSHGDPRGCEGVADHLAAEDRDPRGAALNVDDERFSGRWRVVGHRIESDVSEARARVDLELLEGADLVV